MIIVLVQLAVEQVQYRDFHHTLVEVCSSIFDHFDCYYLLSFQILTLNDLAKSALAENVED